MEKRKSWLAISMAISIVFGMISPSAGAISATKPASTDHIINILDYGADLTGKKESTTAVQKALAAAKNLPENETKVIYFPKGEYHFYEDYAEVRELYVSNTVGLRQEHKDKHIGILVEDLDNVVIDGNQSMFMYHGDITAFAAIDSNNVTFKNFDMDHASPSVVDLTVESAVSGENAVIVSVPSCYNYEVVDGNTIKWYGEKGPVTGEPYWQGTNGLMYCQVYDTISGRCWRGGGLFSNISSIQDLGDGRLKFSYNGKNLPKVGYSYEIRNTTRTTPGAFFWKSNGVEAKNLNIHYLHGFGMVGQLSKNITLDTISFRTRPESGRTTAGFADFVQMSSVGGKVTIRNCDFSVAHDDPINIHGTFLTVEDVSDDGKTLTVKYNHNETAGFPQYYVGDQVDFATKGTMVPIEDSLRTITEVLDDGWGKQTMKIVLDEPVQGLTGGSNYVIENVTYIPEVEISGCKFANIPTRGILVTTRKPVLIENNHFDAMNMASIYISCDAQGWYESGHTENVTIRNNVFDRPGAACILVEPTGRNDSNHQLHSNMTIENNIFNLDKSVEVVNAKSVKNLKIKNNTIHRGNPSLNLELSASKNTLKVGEALDLDSNIGGTSLESQLYRFENCKEVQIANNVYDAGLNQKIEITQGTEESDISIQGDDLQIGKNHKTAPEGQVHYFSSDPSVLHIDKTGRVTGLQNGYSDVILYSVCGDRLYASDPLTFEVAGNVNEANDIIEVSGDKQILSIGETQQMQATVANDAIVKWSVRGDAVTITDDGIITAVQSGIAEVIASVEEQSIYGNMLIAVQKNNEKSDVWSIDREREGKWHIDGANDTLTIEAQPGGDWATGNQASNLFLMQPEEEDFTAIVKMYNKTVSGYEEIGLIAFADQDNYVTIQRKHANGNPNIAVVSEASGRANEDGAISDTFGDELWFKLEKTGNILTGSYSEDGLDWHKVRQVENAELTNCKVGVIACNSSQNTAFTFSEFRHNDNHIPFATISKAPVVTNQNIDIRGNTATIVYDFEADNTTEGNSVYRWYSASAKDAAYAPIVGEEKKSLYLSDAFAGKWIQAEIAPLDAKNRVGQPVKTQPIFVDAVTHDPSDANLVELNLGSTLMPEFTPETHTYDLILPDFVSSLMVQAKPSNPNAIVSFLVNGDPISHNKVMLTGDTTVLEVRIASEDQQASQNYFVNISQQANSMAELKNINLADLSFDPQTSFYHLVTDEITNDLSLSLKANPSSLIRVWYNHEQLIEKHDVIVDLPIPNESGLNTIEAEVTAPDGSSKKMYRICLMKMPSSNANLSNIFIDGVVLEGFDPQTVSYNHAIKTQSVKVVPISVDPKARVEILVDNVVIPDGTISLLQRTTKAVIRVTSDNERVVKEYLLTLYHQNDESSHPSRPDTGSKPDVKPEKPDPSAPSEIPVIQSGKKANVTTKNGDVLTVLVENTNSTYQTIKFEQDGKEINHIDGGITIALPTELSGTGVVAVLVKSDGSETVLIDSYLQNGNMIVNLDGSCNIKIEDRAMTFVDVTKNNWYNQSVDFVTARGLFSGMSTTNFAPNNHMTRGMLATVLYRLDGQPSIQGNMPFSDVDMTQYYAVPIQWASKNGFVTGITENSFAPEQNITREQLVSILYRYSNSPVVTSSTQNYADASSVSVWATDAISWALQTGILVGDDTNKINPRNHATRAEVATILMRYVNMKHEK